MGYELVGRQWRSCSPEFRAYLDTLDLGWVQGITIHHTGAPNLAQRPDGFSVQHMRNLRNHYKNTLGWSAGPHLFIDEHHISGLSSLEKRGTHAVSFNRTHIGIEVLGNYDGPDDPQIGRGAKVWLAAILATRDLLVNTGLPVSAVNFHRDDPRTDKSCPGVKVSKDWVHGSLADQLSDQELLLVPASDQSDRADTDERNSIAERIEAIQWQLDKIREEIGA